MPKYRQVVVETRMYRTVYVLEAKDLQEAEERFERCDWDDEDSEFLETTDRDCKEVVKID